MNHFKEFFGFGEPDEGPDPEQVAIVNAIEDLKWVMADKRGRRFVWSQLEVAGIYRLSYTGDDRTIFNEGRRSVGLKLLAEIDANCPNEYLQMLKENTQ